MVNHVLHHYSPLGLQACSQARIWSFMLGTRWFFGSSSSSNSSIKRKKTSLTLMPCWVKLIVIKMLPLHLLFKYFSLWQSTDRGCKNTASHIGRQFWIVVLMCFMLLDDYQRWNDFKQFQDYLSSLKPIWFRGLLHLYCMCND